MKTLVFFLALLALASLMPAQYPPLPKPLLLPVEMEETLPIVKSGSYFAEAVKIQDCPEDKDNPLGLCDNLLFGGMAMFVSQLSGNIHIKFFPPINNVAQFQITHPGGLTGDAVIERAPILYRIPITSPRFTDEERITTGTLDLTTGVAKTLDYRLCINSNVLEAYKRLNPQLTGCEVWLPGVYGSALGRFEPRADGLLDFTFFGSTFGPLSNNQAGKGDDKVRVPLPFCSAVGNCPGIEAPGSAVHPRVRLTTRAPQQNDCGAHCPDLPINTVQVFTASAYHTLMGDRFDRVNIPELGGGTVGWSHLSGRLYMQFGDRYGDLVPVAIWAVMPDGLLAAPPELPFPGFGLNMAGVDGHVKFPNYTYLATERALTNDPFDFAVGVFNARTGESIGDLVYRGFPVQNLLIFIQQMNVGRIPTDTFRFQGPASFERGPNGSLVFRYNGDIFLDFSTFAWPLPDYNPSRSFRAPQGATLDPFLKFQATSGGTPAVVVKSGDINEVSSFGDQVKLHYSIPCDASNPSFSFEYTNSSSEKHGGTFRMDTLSSASCTNARGSTAAPGEADILTFSGLGTWSKDSDRHLATVQISTAPDSKFFIVQIDGGLVSSADTALTQETTP